MIALKQNHWMTIINIILHKYFSDLTTTCILWHTNFDFNKISSINNNVFLNINPRTLRTSFTKDFYNYTAQDEHFRQRGIYYNVLVKIYIAALEKSNCEGFLAFQDDIPKFAQVLRNASVFSIWRSSEIKLLFAFSKEYQKEDYFQDALFKNHPNILILEAEYMNSTIFSLKTNKFVGSLADKPEELTVLSHYNALNNSFYPEINLFPTDKLQNLQGRELRASVFDYRPYVAVNFERLPQYYDHAEDKPSHLVHVDGTDIRIVHTFCGIYNCTMQFDTTEKEEWGDIFANYSGYGTVGQLLDGKTDIVMDGLYMWYDHYVAVDFTTFIGHSSVICLVPAPIRLVDWFLSIKPFQYTLWLAICICLLVETITLVIARRFEDILENNSSSRSGPNWWHCIQFGYITTMKLLISQSSKFIVNSNTVWTLLFACYMIDIILTSIYGGGLSAILTVPSLQEVADSLERFYSHNIRWTGNSYLWVQSLRDDKNNDPIFKRILSNFEINTLAEMRKMSLTENMGFVLELLEFGHFANDDFITPQALDRLKLMLEDLYNNFTVMMVPRLWAHLPKFNEFILAWHSSGFNKFWEWKITAEYLNIQQQNRVRASRYTRSKMGHVKLDMKNFAGLILIWLVGVVFSILAFAAELVVYKIR